MSEKNFWQFYQDITQGKLAQAKVLLDTNPELAKQTVSHRLEGYVSLLHLAAESGNEEAVNMLIEAGADISLADGSKRNAIHYAAAGRQSKLVKRFVTDRPELLNQECHEWTESLLSKAVEHDDGDLVKWLLENGSSDTMATYGLFTSTGYYTKEPHVEMAELLLKERPHIVNNTCTDTKALHRAATKGNPEIVKTLLKAGADAAGQDWEGGTPLFHLSRYGGRLSSEHNVEVAELLLAARPDISLTQNLGGAKPMDILALRMREDADQARGIYQLVEKAAELQENKYAKLREMKNALDSAHKCVGDGRAVDTSHLLRSIQSGRAAYRNENGTLDTNTLSREFSLANPQVDRTEVEGQWQVVKKAVLEQLTQNVDTQNGREFMAMIGECPDFVPCIAENNLGAIAGPRTDLARNSPKPSDAHTPLTVKDVFQAVVHSIQDVIEQFQHAGVSHDNGTDGVHINSIPAGPRNLSDTSRSK